MVDVESSREVGGTYPEIETEDEIVELPRRAGRHDEKWKTNGRGESILVG